MNFGTSYLPFFRRSENQTAKELRKTLRNQLGRFRISRTPHVVDNIIVLLKKGGMVDGYLLNVRFNLYKSDCGKNRIVLSEGRKMYYFRLVGE